MIKSYFKMDNPNSILFSVILFIKLNDSMKIVMTFKVKDCKKDLNMKI